MVPTLLTIGQKYSENVSNSNASILDQPESNRQKVDEPNGEMAVKNNSKVNNLNPRITVASNQDADYNLVIDDGLPVSSARNNSILSKRGVLQKASPGANKEDMYSVDDEPLDNAKIVLELQSNISEESKRRGDSIKSNLSKDTTYSYRNPVLNLLDKVNNLNVEQVIKNLKVNVYALKTALMYPIDLYIENHSDTEIGPETYLRYSNYDECFGLFLVIKNKNSK